MRKLILTTLLLMLVTALFAQTVEQVISEVEKNNTTLLAIQNKLDAESLENETGIYLANPELAFNYLWGNQSAIGNRTDFAITQSFDFPTAYGYKKQISEHKNQQLQLEFLKQKRELQLQVSLICIDLIHFNALKKVLDTRIEHAQKIASSYALKFETGECNKLEFNKAQINLLNLTKTMEALEIIGAASLADLVTLNGGNAIEFTAIAYTAFELPIDFDLWFEQARQNNPVLAWLGHEIEISQKQVKLSKAQSLPKINAGYMSEKVVGEQFQGLTMGVSIPLWENKNTVKQARLNALAIESKQHDAKLQFYGALKSLYDQADAMQKTLLGYRSSLDQFSNTQLLQKAFDNGEISLIDYMLENSYNYESVNHILELEKEMNSVMAELYQFQKEM